MSAGRDRPDYSGLHEEGHLELSWKHRATVRIDELFVCLHVLPITSNRIDRAQSGHPRRRNLTD